MAHKKIHRRDHNQQFLSTALEAGRVVHVFPNEIHIPKLVKTFLLIIFLFKNSRHLLGNVVHFRTCLKDVYENENQEIVII